MSVWIRASIALDLWTQRRLRRSLSETRFFSRISVFNASEVQGCFWLGRIVFDSMHRLAPSQKCFRKMSQAKSMESDSLRRWASWVGVNNVVCEAGPISFTKKPNLLRLGVGLDRLLTQLDYYWLVSFQGITFFDWVLKRSTDDQGGISDNADVEQVTLMGRVICHLNKIICLKEQGHSRVDQKIDVPIPKQNSIEFLGTEGAQKILQTSEKVFLGETEIWWPICRHKNEGSGFQSQFNSDQFQRAGIGLTVGIQMFLSINGYPATTGSFQSAISLEEFKAGKNQFRVRDSFQARFLEQHNVKFNHF